MSHLRIPVAVFVLLLATQCCCCCQMLGIGGVEFTTGDFTDVPRYPGSLQTTESNILFDLLLGIFDPLGDVEWKHYTTGDSQDRVLDWYEENLPGYGWELSDDEEQSNNLTFRNTDDPTVMLAIVAEGPFDLETQDTHILIGRIDILGGD